MNKLFVLALLGASFMAQAQQQPTAAPPTALPATAPAPATTVPTQAPAATATTLTAPLPGTAVVAPAPSAFFSFNNNPYNSCEKAATLSGAKAMAEQDKFLATHFPGYVILDEHTVNCGDQRARMLVLVTFDHSLPAQVVGFRLPKEEHLSLDLWGRQKAQAREKPAAPAKR